MRKKTKKLKKVLVDFVSQRLVELTWGRFIYANFQFIFTLAIFVKVYNIANWLKILLLITAIVCLFVTGWIFNKYFRKEYQKRNYKDTLYK
jgi:hypothetical protein